MAKSNVTFEVTESFLEMTESHQDRAVKAFVAANPKSKIVLTGEAGSVPPYLRRQSGKRFEICSMLGGSAREFVKFATPFGGGVRDLSAALSGGYSRTSKFYGQSFISLHAT